MKKLAMVLICCILSFSCIGCGNINYQAAISENKEVSYGGGYFTVVTEWIADGNKTCSINLTF